MTQRAMKAWVGLGRHLRRWVTEGVGPPASLMLERDSNNKPREDEHGNSVGGLRAPYVDVLPAT